MQPTSEAAGLIHTIYSISIKKNRPPALYIQYIPGIGLLTVLDIVSKLSTVRIKRVLPSIPRHPRVAYTVHLAQYY